MIILFFIVRIGYDPQEEKKDELHSQCLRELNKQKQFDYKILIPIIININEDCSFDSLKDGTLF